MHFRYVSRSMSVANCEFVYEARLDAEGNVSVVVKEPEGKEQKTILRSDKFLKGLNQIVLQHKMYAWHGFAKSNSNVLDGYAFNFEATYTDGTQITASGTNSYPKGYREACEEFMKYFEGIRNKE